MPSIGARRHAEKVAALGAGAVVAQGSEGGGHTGSVPTSILLPQVTAAVSIPVFGAGGFCDGRGLVAALAYGAAGIAMGTRFLLTRESPVPAHVKQEYLRRGVTDTVVTTVLDGVPQRVLRTELADRLERGGSLSRLARSVRHAAGFRKMSGTSWPDLVREGVAMKRSHGLPWPAVIMAANTPMMLRASMVDGRTDLGTLASGQVAGVIDDLPTCAELIDRIMTEADAILTRLARPRVPDARQPQPHASHGLLTGKTVVVTAAAGTGIGFATARRCAEEGARVAISDRHERRLGEAAERAGRRSRARSRWRFLAT